MTEIGIHIPEFRNKYPFAKLQPGESAFFACIEKAPVRKAAYRLANYHKWKIVVRSLPDGVRVWRM